MTPGLAWITGASSGIGRALALDLAARGWAVAASARSEAALTELAALHPAIQPLPLDVTDLNAVRAAVATLPGLPGLTILNAGTHQPMQAADFSAETAARLMAVNYQGVVNGLDALLPGLRDLGSGTVAVVASVAGYVGLPTAAAYGPTKAALINLCESLAPELARDGVRLKLVNPGFVKTPLTDRNPFPMPWLMDADDAARRILRGLDKTGLEVAFPLPMAAMLKLFRLLPYGLSLPLIRRGTGM